MIGFAEFVREAGGYNPYPWQIEFAELCAAGEPPSAVTVPTGAGKTTAIYGLVWALAMQADRKANERTVGVRSIWAIDRRILVDDVYETATALSNRLDQACDDTGDALCELARALLSIAGATSCHNIDAVKEARERGLEPLAATRWRGGIDEFAHLRPPLQPEIIMSTVAQAGSRILFRGYGVSDRSHAIAAGLCAVDTNICLDEVHIAEPFRQTLQMIAVLREREQANVRTPVFNTIVVSATPPPQRADASTSVALSEEDIRRLGARYSGEKWAQLREHDGAQEDHILAAAEELLDRGHTEIACVVNTVAVARKVFDKLARSLARRSGEPLLLIGPQRPADRQHQIDRCWSRLGRIRAAGTTGGEPSTPLVVVATQTIEVGVDISVSGLVTQSASSTALIQRFGRVNRFGDSERAGEAIVVRDADSWLYGDSEPVCWDWLKADEDSNGLIDISVAALTDSRRPSTTAPGRAPKLLDSVLTQLVQTNPRPAPMAEPDIEPFIRGIGTETSSDVKLVWRCDLRLHDDSEAAFEHRREILRSAPPRASEMLPLSIGAAKQMLAKQLTNEGQASAIANDSDIEGVTTKRSFTFAGVSESGPHIAVIRGDDVFDVTCQTGHQTPAHPLVLRIGQVRPGDVLVLPVEMGGADGFGLKPDGRKGEGPTDLTLHRTPREEGAPVGQRTVVRLNRDALAYIATVKQTDKQAREADDSVVLKAGQKMRVVSEVLAGACEDPLSGQRFRVSGKPWEDVIQVIGPDAAERLGLSSADEWSVRYVSAQPPSITGLQDEEADLTVGTWIFEAVVDGVSTSHKQTRVRGASVTIADHCDAVASRVLEYATAIGIADDAVEALRTAALAHDLGKADPRIQAWFAGGEWSDGMDLLAKSTYGVEDRSTSRRARWIAGVPKGLRHEQASVAILRDALTADNGNGSPFDARLSMHCVGTHHGHGRPLPPISGDDGRAPTPFTIKIGAIGGSATGGPGDGWAEGAWIRDFFALNDEYGSWTLAYFEALLAMADRTVSGEGR